SEPMRQEMVASLAAPDLELLNASSVADAMELVKREYLDGIALDWAVSEVAEAEFIRDLQPRGKRVVSPVANLGPPAIESAKAAELHQLSRASAVRYAPSMERLLDEVVLMLHRSEENLTARQRRTLAEVRQTDPMLAGRKVLVVDDDLRNIFALTSVLE